MQKVNRRNKLSIWEKGKAYKGFHPTGYNQISWSNVRKLEKMSLMNSTKCCATGTCVNTNN
jgi:ribosomal protein L32E